MQLPLVPMVPFNRIQCDELIAMKPYPDDWTDGRPIPTISFDLLSYFLGFVHNFTVMSLEAQATAFSFDQNGVIKYLALLPQVNEVDTLTAIEKFCQKTRQPVDACIPRCWIHTHPMYKGFMSSTDLYQLCGNYCQNPESFGIALPPRKEGLKVL